MTHSKLDEHNHRYKVPGEPNMEAVEYKKKPKLDIDEILETLQSTGVDIATGRHHSSGEPGLKSAKQALLEAFEAALPPEQSWGEHTIEPYSHTAGWNAYRNEAIKVIRGTK